jgi:antitoxin ParD1/3/4
MSITLNAEQEEIIQTFLQTGQFESAEEVIQVALRLLEQQDKEYQQWLADVRIKIDEATEASKHTPPVDGPTFVAGILERFRQNRATQK